MDIRSSAPSDEVVRKLQDAVNAMCLLFGGYIVTPPGTWTASTTTVVAFSDADSAMSFSACFQHALLYTQWAEEVRQAAPIAGE